ncbi:hypothetical protein EMWEY_00050170 [Eimeria maxima]|uniref:Uncharacterized protein n=1 Tax=Eimeria maxima TaxID=5804 RepID=U6M2X4_EIMMA|nr:hypothetical protein EMWEY_00050170 [Eimeria maxima]CDJ58381.1 hypothetical protein EMWEY_00050170 [Eimeria maxima]
MSKRSLSTSYLEDQWLEGCVEVGDGTNQREAVESGVAGEDVLEQDTGESTALKTLNDLKCILTLGAEIAPSFPSEKMAVLVVLLLTICTQELIFYGVHSTPQVELERQRTLDFILQEGQRALAQLEAVGQSFQTLGRGKEVLQLLEEFRTPQKESNSKELAVEARMSSYRIVQCKEALQQLQPWIQSSISIPEEVAERLLKVVSHTRQAGKARLRRDLNAAAWVEIVQERFGVSTIAEKQRLRRPLPPRLRPEDQIMKYQNHYGLLALALARSIQTARKDQPVEHQRDAQHLHGDQQQQKDNQTLHEQQHPSTSHISDNNDDSRPTPQPAVDQPATATNSVLAHALHHPLPSPVPRQGPLLTTSNTLVNLPLLDPTQSSPADSQQNIPIAQAERWEQSPPHSTPSGYESQHAAMAQEWSMFNSSTANSVLRANAPLHTTIRYRHQAGMQHHIHPVSSDASYVWWYAPSPFGFEVDSLAAFPHPLPLPRPIPAATLSPSGYIRTVFPLTASSTGSPTPRNPLPTPQFPSPRPSADPSRLPQPTEGLSLRFSRPILHRPPSDVPRHGPEPSTLVSGGRRSIPSWRFEPPRAFWPPTAGGDQGDAHLPSTHNLVDLDPLGPLVAEALSSALSDSDSPTGSGQGPHRDQGWP